MSGRGGRININQGLELELDDMPRSPSHSGSGITSWAAPQFSASSMSYSSVMTTVEDSCVSSKSQDPKPETITRVMPLVGCPRCLMYVMLSDQLDPKCPKCKTTVFLDFFSQGNHTHNHNNNNPHNSSV